LCMVLTVLRRRGEGEEKEKKKKKKDKEKGSDSGDEDKGGRVPRPSSLRRRIVVYPSQFCRS
jgi:hypothetical protein